MPWYTKDTCISCKIILFIFSRPEQDIKHKDVFCLKYNFCQRRHRKGSRKWRSLSETDKTPAVKSCIHPKPAFLVNSQSNTALLGMSDHCHHTAHDSAAATRGMGWGKFSWQVLTIAGLIFWSVYHSPLQHAQIQVLLYAVLKNGTYEFRFC